MSGLKLTRAQEMLLGVLLPAMMLAGYELYARYKGHVSSEYLAYQQMRKERKEQAPGVTKEEAYEIRKQNKFGLNVISFSLLFIAILLFILSLVTSKGGGVVGGISAIILVSALIPYFKAKKISLG